MQDLEGYEEMTKKLVSSLTSEQLRLLSPEQIVEALPDDRLDALIALAAAKRRRR